MQSSTWPLLNLREWTLSSSTFSSSRADRDLGKSIALWKRKQSVRPHNYSTVILTHPVRQSMFEEWLHSLCYWTALAYQRISPSRRFCKPTIYKGFISPRSLKHASAAFCPHAFESVRCRMAERWIEPDTDSRNQMKCSLWELLWWTH